MAASGAGVGEGWNGVGEFTGLLVIEFSGEEVTGALVGFASFRLQAPNKKLNKIARARPLE